MQTFTGFEYIKIDIANQFGLDKDLFEDRIEWVDTHMNDLESLVDEAAEPPLYLAAVKALRKAQNKEPTGFMMGLDACSSGLQIMGAIYGCKNTCNATGLVDPNRRADVYTDCTAIVNEKLAKAGHSTVEIPRKDVKQSLMTHFYGSTAKPKEIFGVDADDKPTPALQAFYEAQAEIAPGAVDVMETFLGSWQPWALAHSWTMPDGFHVNVKVMEPMNARVEVDELDGATFTYQWYENQGSEKGLSIAANLTHSIDGMVVREMGRRCNYSFVEMSNALDKLTQALIGKRHENVTDSFMSLVFAEPSKIDEFTATRSTGDIKRLYDLVSRVLDQSRPFPVVCVHDEFKCGPNHMNTLRYWYKEILAELAESNILQDLLSQVNEQTVTVDKLDPNVPNYIRNSNYALS